MVFKQIRIFNGKKYKYYSTNATKTLADNQAKRIRSRGKLARVVPATAKGKWNVYIC